MHENQLKKHRRAKGWVCRYPNSHLVLVWIQNAFVFVNGLCFLCGSHALFTRPASTDFSKFFFKTGSHGTIHTFKNNFAIVFSVFNNKRYPNRPLMVRTQSRPYGLCHRPYTVAHIKRFGTSLFCMSALACFYA